MLAFIIMGAFVPSDVFAVFSASFSASGKVQG